MCIRKTPLKFNLALIQEEINALTKRLKDKFDIYNQICLNHREHIEDPFFDGARSLWDKISMTVVGHENEFCVFNENLRDWYLHQVYQSVKEYSTEKIGRFRIMRLLPKTCYSLHRDNHLRFHMAVTTNPGSFFVFQTEDFIVKQIPADGYVYTFEGWHPHTAINSGPNDRLHLCFATYS